MSTRGFDSGVTAGTKRSLRVGVIGAGVMGSNHARVLAGLPDTTLVGIVDPLPAHRTRASDDQGACFQHFHCMVQVDQSSGKLYAAWLDNRNGGKGGTYYSVSADQGASFSANKRISDQDFTFNPDHQNAQLNFLGDYFGFLFDGTKLRVAWSDPRNGNDAQVIYAGAAP